VVLAVGLMLPGTALLIGLRWASGPLSRITQMIRRRIAGDFSARIMPGGPANITDLAISLNSLADESDRMRLAEAERSRLLVLLRQVSTRIREHLHADAVISEAVSAIRDHLGADFVWVGLVEGSEVRLGAADQSHRDAAGSLVEVVPSGSADWMRQMYRGKSSYRVRDLRAPEAGEIPAGIRQILDAAGGGSVLLTAFGAGPEPMGAIALLRGDQARPWTEAEMQALEYVAEDVGRGLEHARVYEAEERLVSELQSVDQAKNSFIAASSHDVRTPLTSILGNLEMLADGEAGPMPAQQARMLDAVRRNALRLQTLIEDMLTISKIDLGAFTSDLKPTDLASVVPGAAEIIRPAAAEAGLIFTVDCPDAGLIIDGDPEQLDRVLINLLSNAVKYTPRGGSVTLAAAREDGCAVLTVADTGMGVPQAEQKSLFTRFFRASNAVERAIPGSGLGLSIVGSVVANHNGKVELTSAEGTGTTVTVRIPLLEGREPALPGMRRPVPLPRRQPGQRP
jgi:signal transduction histidine kinase